MREQASSAASDPAETASATRKGRLVGRDRKIETESGREKPRQRKGQPARQ